MRYIAKNSNAKVIGISETKLDNTVYNSEVAMDSKNIKTLNGLFFIYQGFLSRTLTTHRTAGEGRRPSFIPLYYFLQLTNIQTILFATLHVR